MGGKSQKQKGDRVEREIAQRHKSLGLNAQRVPLSGAAEGKFSGDLRIDVPLGPEVSRASGEIIHDNFELLAECKARKAPAPWASIKKWLGVNDILFLKEDFENPLVVMTWNTYEAFLKAAMRV